MNPSSILEDPSRNLPGLLQIRPVVHHTPLRREVWAVFGGKALAKLGTVALDSRTKQAFGLFKGTTAKQEMQSNLDVVQCCYMCFLLFLCRGFVGTCMPMNQGQHVDNQSILIAGHSIGASQSLPRGTQKDKAPFQKMPRVYVKLCSE